MSEIEEESRAQAHADLRELIALSKLFKFNLYEVCRLFSQLRLPPFSSEIDEVATIATGRRVVRYKLAEWLAIPLAALRTFEVGVNEIERSASGHDDLQLNDQIPANSASNPNAKTG